MSFPATFTKENLSCFPIFTTWLQFSTFLNGILIGGLFAIFQFTIPAETLSRVSKRIHLQEINTIPTQWMQTILKTSVCDLGFVWIKTSLNTY
jgi:hypothetical protein